jgi:hypothetical protein
MDSSLKLREFFEETGFSTGRLDISEMEEHHPRKWPEPAWRGDMTC